MRWRCRRSRSGEASLAARARAEEEREAARRLQKLIDESQAHVNGKVRMPELACDGVLVATPAGSTAYNLSANGPILPLESEMLALTPISPFRPRRWRGAILPDRMKIILKVLDPAKRPVAAVADQKELRDIAEVRLEIAQDTALTLLFDKGQSLEERIVAEQFVTG